MKILYVSQYFPPEMGAPSARVHELSKHWVQAGHQVTVLTGFPNHPTGVVHPGYRGKMRRLVARGQVDGIDVVRTWLLPRPNRRTLERVLNYASFWLSSSIVGMFLPRPDVIIGTSPQLLVGLSGWWVAQVKEVPFVLEIRDLWPESLAASGVGGENSITARMVGRLAGFLYSRADHVAVVTPAFKERLAADWGVPASRCSVVRNGVETELFKPNGDAGPNGGARGQSGSARKLKEALGVGDRFVVSYVGTIGMAHGLDSVLEAAERMRDSRPDVLFMLIGEGAERERLEGEARSRGLSNVRFVPQQPRSEVPRYIQASDVCLVLLKKADAFRTVIPTKMLEFMSCSRPVVLGVDGQARSVMEEAGAGIYVEPENVDALVAGIDALRADEGLRDALGRAGRDYVVSKLSRRSTAEDYIGVLEKVVAGN